MGKQEGGTGECLIEKMKQGHSLAYPLISAVVMDPVGSPTIYAGRLWIRIYLNRIRTLWH